MDMRNDIDLLQQSARWSTASGLPEDVAEPAPGRDRIASASEAVRFRIESSLGGSPLGFAFEDFAISERLRSAVLITSTASFDRSKMVNWGT